MLVIKKDGTTEEFDFNKVVVAVAKASLRIGKDLSDENLKNLEVEVRSFLRSDTVTVDRMHQIVEMSLSRIDFDIAESYRGYRNWRKEMSNMMETIVVGVNKSMEKRDRSNSNSLDILFSSRRINVSKILLKEMFMKYFLNDKERQAVKDGFIYPHDIDNRLIGTHNCCVVKAENIMDNGFWINGFFCKEPKNITKAVSILGDIIVTCASAQYGGFSVAEIDTTLAKYCEKTYNHWYNVFYNLTQNEELSMEKAKLHTKIELDDALQGLEFELNTRESSRGDYPFVTFSFGKSTSYWAKEVAKTILSVRRKGHGGSVKQKVVFPKLVSIINRDGSNDDILDDSILTSSVALYPDYIRDDVATPMGCRSFLSDYILEDGTNLLWGRGNIGVVTLNLPMIYQNAKVNNLNFKDELIKCVDMCRDIHAKTYDYIGKQKAWSNPLMFTQGGFYGGNLNPEDEIAPVVKKYFTASIGTTALNELSILHNSKSLREDDDFANYVIDTIQERIDYWKKEDGYAYSIYGTPAENLCGVQVEQFRKKFGIIKGVSDKDYFSNSFHYHVSEDITPFEKQDGEVGLFHKHTGGHIQYVRITNPSNLKAMKDTVKRGVLDYGLYQGTNLNSCTCNKCGHQGHDFDRECPVCHSDDYNEFIRICGYLGWSKKNKDWTLNDAKMSELLDRKSM